MSKMIIANWKMNHTAKEARAFAPGFIKNLETLDISKNLVGICPNFLALDTVVSQLGHAISIGAQNFHPETKGAFTGETSLQMLEDAGASFALIGHSERRQLFGESYDFLSKKLASCLESRLFPIFCVGEVLSERESGITFSVLGKQLEGAVEILKNTPQQKASKLVIAYEPVWAIGTGKTPTLAQISETHDWIKQFLNQTLGEQVTGNIKLLYGGSVTPENSADISRCSNVDGALVGGASLKPESFSGVIRGFLR